MAYDSLEYARIEGEFLSLAGGDLWDRIEHGLWLRRQREHAKWSQHGQWWRKTALGKRTTRLQTRARAKRLQTVVVAVCACTACGKLFERTAYQRARGHGRVCSPACRGRARQNIALVTLDGESLPLARWAERYGIALQTVWKRRNEGWDVRTALQTPVRAKRTA